jgi:ribosomal protein bL25 (Ctc-form)
VYGGTAQPTPIELDHNALFHALRNEAFHSSILTMKLDGAATKVLLRDVQMHPFRNEILHVDFQRVDENRKIHMKVPLHFINGEISPAVKLNGAIVSHVTTEVDVSCLPKDLPEFIEVDLSQLDVGHSIHVSALKMPGGRDGRHARRRIRWSRRRWCRVRRSRPKEERPRRSAAEGAAAAATRRRAPAAERREKKEEQEGRQEEVSALRLHRERGPRSDAGLFRCARPHPWPTHPLVAGLGNPGREYARTRHNAGFWFVDAPRAKLGATLRDGVEVRGEVAKAGDVRLVKPSTFMNLSGASVGALARSFDRAGRDPRRARRARP